MLRAQFHQECLPILRESSLVPRLLGILVHEAIAALTTQQDCEHQQLPPSALAVSRAAPSGEPCFRLWPLQTNNAMDSSKDECLVPFVRHNSGINSLFPRPNGLS